MQYIFANNVYNLLGLSTSVDQKEVIKRSKELINLIKVGNLPNYDLDIKELTNIRNEKLIMESVQRFQSPKKKIKEYFFWFNIIDDIDKKAFLHIQQKDYINAKNEWSKYIGKKNNYSYRYKKNICILYMLIMRQNEDINYLHESLLAWKDILNDDDFWNLFISQYQIFDTQSFNIDIINDFKNNVLKYLSDIYSELYEIHQNSIYIKEFYSHFNIIGDVLQKNILDNIYKNIGYNIEHLSSIRFGGFNIVYLQLKKFKLALSDIKKYIDKIKDLGMYEYGETIVVRDTLASVIREISVNLYNNHNDIANSKDMLDIGLDIVASSTVRKLLQDDLDVLSKYLNNKNVTNDIIKLVSEKKYKEALNITDNNAENPDVQSIINSQRNICISQIIINDFEIAIKAFKQDNIKSKLYDLYLFIEHYLSFLSINTQSIDRFMQMFNTELQKINVDDKRQFNDYKERFFTQIQNDIKTDDKLVLIIYETYMYIVLFDIQEKKHQEFLKKISWIFPENLLSFIGDISIIIFYIFLILFGISIVFVILFLYFGNIIIFLVKDIVDSTFQLQKFTIDFLYELWGMILNTFDMFKNMF